MNKKDKKEYFYKAAADGVINNRKFFSTVKPFLTSKGFLHNVNISVDINGNIVKDEQKLSKKYSY